MKTILNEITPLSERDCFYIVDRHKTEFAYPLHQHLEFELNFIEHGNGLRRIVGDSVETIGDYDLVLICGNLVHVWEQAQCTSRDIREITVQFAPDIFPEALMSRRQFASINKMFLKARNGLAFPLSTIMRVYPLLDSLASEQQEFYRVLKIMNILFELSLVDDARVLASNSFAKIEPASDSRRIRRVKEFVEAHYTEPIRLSTAAELASMSPIAFSRFFKRRTGCSFSDYIISLRVGAASRLLVDSMKSIAEICYECGFNNISNFNRMFKKRHGVSPKTFREYYHKTKIIC
ncbi:MAG: helix-turn-helix domain-containing protein [Alistipes sp.]|nr:helix-turn-helix domain-containing protein [Alistipes sp.]